MTGAALAALLLAMIAVPLRASLWHVPFTFFSYAMALRPMFGAAFSALVAGAIGAMVGGGDPAGLAVGAIVGTFFLIVSSRRQRFVRGAVLSAFRMRKDPSAKPVLQKLITRASRKLSAEAFANLAMTVTPPLTAIGEWEQAAELMTRATPADARQKLQHGQALATIQLHQGQTSDARATIASLERPAPAEIERWLVATEALLAIIDGGVEEALAIVGPKEDPTMDPGLCAAHTIVRAHALACQGHENRARQELQRVVDQVGLVALERAVNPVGPATDLARDLIKNGQAPHGEEE